MFSTIVFVLFIAPCASDSCVELESEMFTVMETQQECHTVADTLNRYANPEVEYYYCQPDLLEPGAVLVVNDPL